MSPLLVLKLGSQISYLKQTPHAWVVRGKFCLVLREVYVRHPKPYEGRAAYIRAVRTNS